MDKENCTCITDGWRVVSLVSSFISLAVFLFVDFIEILYKRLQGYETIQERYDFMCVNAPVKMFFGITFIICLLISISGAAIS